MKVCVCVCGQVTSVFPHHIIIKLLIIKLKVKITLYDQAYTYHLDFFFPLRFFFTTVLLDLLSHISICLSVPVSTQQSILFFEAFQSKLQASVLFSLSTPLARFSS